MNSPKKRRSATKPKADCAPDPTLLSQRNCRSEAVAVKLSQRSSNEIGIAEESIGFYNHCVGPRHRWLLACACFVVSCTSANLLENPHFTEGQLDAPVPGWGGYAYDGSQYPQREFLLRPGGRKGSGAVLVVAQQHQWSLADQHVRIEPDAAKSVRFSVWMRADTPLAKVELALFVHAPQQETYGLSAARRACEVTNEWVKFAVTLDLASATLTDIAVEEYTVRAIVQCYGPAARLCVDDASLQLVKADPQVIELMRGCVAQGHEAGLLTLDDGSVAIYYPIGAQVHRRVSYDAGQTWTAPQALHDQEGRTFAGTTPELLRLPSGAIGMFLNEGANKLYFCVSTDEGATWSVRRQVNGGETARMCNGSALVTAGGRIVLPTFAQMSSWWSQTHPNSPGPHIGMYCWFSDDEGQTWQNSEVIWLVHEDKLFWFEEGSIVELRDGRLLMYARTPMGRLFKSYSADDGETWSDPAPTPLASAYAPCTLARLPNGDLLCVWNQNSLEEDRRGLRRHRLTCAISEDEGESWKHFRNLESLDDTVRIAERPILWDVYSYHHEQDYRQPEDRRRYRRAPGVLRCAYPSVAFTDDNAVVAYDYGKGALTQDLIKVVSVSLDWFYENP